MTAQMWAHGYLNQVSQVIAALSTEELAAATDLLLDTWRRQARVYVCGNGGSAAIASHFAGDLNKGANVAGRHRFRAACLMDNTTALLAWSNDNGYETGIAEQLRNFVEQGDLVIGFSGSGNSVNVINTMALARQAGARTLGLCGFDGGQLRANCDVAIHVRCSNMEQVEDAFSVACHTLLYTLRRCLRQEPVGGNPLLVSRVDTYPE